MSESTDTPSASDLMSFDRDKRWAAIVATCNTREHFERVIALGPRDTNRPDWHTFDPWDEDSFNPARAYWGILHANKRRRHTPVCLVDADQGATLGEFLDAHGEEWASWEGYDFHRPPKVCAAICDCCKENLWQWLQENGRTLVLVTPSALQSLHSGAGDDPRGERFWLDPETLTLSEAHCVVDCGWCTIASRDYRRETARLMAAWDAAHPKANSHQRYRAEEKVAQKLGPTPTDKCAHCDRGRGLEAASEWLGVSDEI